MRRLFACAGAVMALLAPLTGCDSPMVGEWLGLQLDDNPPFVPAGAHAVSVDRTKFGQQDNPLSNRDAGDVVDDLSKLQGCWGAFKEIPEGMPFGAFLQLATFYHFEFGDKVGSYELWQEGVLGIKVAMAADVRYEIVGPGRIRVTPQPGLQSASNLRNADTGEIETFDFDSSLLGKEVRVTLDGDVMLLQEGSDSKEVVVYRRMDCPQEEVDPNQNDNQNQ